MKPFKNLSISSSYFFVSTLTFIPLLAYAARFDIKNNCNIIIWAAAVPGGGRQINPGGTWSLEVRPNSTSRNGHIWARTGCSFNGSGVGTCQTGDCGGLFQCLGRGYGAPPHTLAEFGLDVIADSDLYDISLVKGFNVPMIFSSTSLKCTSIDCTGDLIRNCPTELKAPGGCYNPCTVFKTEEYCCDAGITNCKATNYSMFLKGGCPGAYSFPVDGKLTQYMCPSGNNFNVVFCPLGSL
ncbi:protein P21-like [Castanea sativa]|uniref:protein P21-like n=1 Tax=Castanea sativa TaxID=21020 RepID=UPI003F64E393